MTVSLEATSRSQHFADALRAVEPDPFLLGSPVADGIAGTTIVVAEDDPTCRRALQHFLRRSGYTVGEAATVASTLEAVAQHADLVIVDLDQDGGTSEALSRIRHHSSIPVIVCSGRASERDRVSLFNLGADDFLSKPYSFAELEARIRAVLRRGTGAPATTLEHGDLVIDYGTRTVTVGLAEVPMTRKEFDLLAFLAAAPGRVFSRDDLLERGLGLEWTVAGPVHRHRAHPTRPAQDRGGPGKPALDHDHSRHRLSLRSTGCLTDIGRGPSQRTASQIAQPINPVNTTAVTMRTVAMFTRRKRLCPLTTARSATVQRASSAPTPTERASW